MSDDRGSIGVQAIDRWRRCPVYRARIDDSKVAGIVVKSARRLQVGKRVSFAMLVDLNGIDTDSHFGDNFSRVLSP